MGPSENSIYLKTLLKSWIFGYLKRKNFKILKILKFRISHKKNKIFLTKFLKIIDHPKFWQKIRQSLNGAADSIRTLLGTYNFISFSDKTLPLQPSSKRRRTGWAPLLISQWIKWPIRSYLYIWYIDMIELKWHPDPSARCASCSALDGLTIIHERYTSTFCTGVHCTCSCITAMHCHIY